MHLHIDNVGEYLKDVGIKPSLQRIKIFDFINRSTRHPSVDDIYQKLVDDIPTLSKTTIYNTLNLFVQANIVSAISIEESEMRYDINDNGHGHFKCVECNRIFDIDMDMKMRFSGEPNLNGFEIQNISLYFKGVCKDCADKQIVDNTVAI